MRYFVRHLATALIALAVIPSLASAQAEGNRNIRFGMPTAAKSDPAQLEDFLIEREQYVLSYNDKRKTPNWVSWNLHKADLGDASRGKFAADPKLPNDFTKVTTKMYNGGGFDRGHMCNSGDRTNSESDNDATFFMTNVIPQSANNNQKAWERLETYCRGLAKEGKDLHIVCGPFGVGGTGLNGQKTTIGPANCKITVPSLTWKVIMVLAKPGAEPTKRTRTIAVRMPNDMSVNADWPKYRVSIAEIEEMTGYKFFSKLAPDLATALKEDVDDVEVSVKPVKPPKKKTQDPQGQIDRFWAGQRWKMRIE